MLLNKKGSPSLKQVVAMLIAVILFIIVLITIVPLFLGFLSGEAEPINKNGGSASTTIYQQPQNEIETREKIARLGNGRITINHDNACPIGQTTGCTNVAELPDLAINSLVALTESCDCDLVITGGTEPGHETHGPGISIVDLKLSSKLKSHILENSATSKQTDLGREYTVGSNTYLEEIDHWHVVFKQSIA